MALLAASLIASSAAQSVDATTFSSTVEAETMHGSSTSSKIFSDSTASGGQALMLFRNGTVSTEFYGSPDGVIVRARGDQCRGAPRMVVKVDGVQQLSISIRSTTWTDYALSIPPSSGKHVLAISFTNDYHRSRSCDRNLRLDKVSFMISGEGNAPTGFVTRSGTSFVLDSKPLHFVGANMYNAAGDPGIYECGPWMQNPDTELEDWFARFKRDSGGQVVRFWAYQSYTKGGTDWSAFDRVMRLANKYGLKVIPVLENQWVECSEGGYKYSSWYSDGYLKPYGSYPLSYKEYVRRVVERYKDEPAVAAWMLMNEAESKKPSGEEDPEALYAFASDMSVLIKGLDQNHLVTLGSIGTGQPGVSGSNYQRLYALPTLDFVEFHDYGANDEAMPGALANARHTARELNKPILMGEAGMTTCGAYNGSQQETSQSRAQKLEAKIGAFFDEGGAGYLIWAWHPNSDCSYDFTTGDPLNTVLTKYIADL